MSLVDYASSDEDEPVSSEGEKKQGIQRNDGLQIQNANHHPLPPNLRPNTQNQRLELSTDKQAETSSNQLETPTVKLPDASLLLNSPALSSGGIGVGDHTFRVAAAKAENASQKRESDGLVSSYRHSKIPRGTLPRTKNVPDTEGGLLLPPQLRGRSNIVTEDMGRLFVKKHDDPSH